MARPPRVLIVEDDPSIRLLLGIELPDHGFDALIVAGAGSALQALEDEELDALVTNIDLGEAMDGFDIARHARAKKPGLPVIYVSGGALYRAESEGVEGGVAIPKPYLPGTLAEAVGDLLDQAAIEPTKIEPKPVVSPRTP